MDSMLEKESLDFVITSLPWATNPMRLIKVLVEHGVPPPCAADCAGLLGAVTQAQVSAAHME